MQLVTDDIVAAVAAEQADKLAAGYSYTYFAVAAREIYAVASFVPAADHDMKVETVAMVGQPLQRRFVFRQLKAEQND